MMRVVVATAVPDYLEDCMRSLQKQTFRDFEVSVRFDVHGLGALRMRHDAILKAKMEADDIVVLLDGDDALRPEALAKVQETFDRNPQALLAYGGVQEDRDGELCYTDADWAGGIRKAKWKFWHLRAFRYGLYREVLRRNISLSCFCWNGTRDFYTVCTDVAILLPMMEIAGPERVAYIREFIYCYRFHALNVRLTQTNLQAKAYAEITGKPPIVREPPHMHWSS